MVISYASDETESGVLSEGWTKSDADARVVFRAHPKMS